MERFLSEVASAMIRYDAGDPRRIQHALKVFAFAGAIGAAENLAGPELEILETAALLHDIGIHESEQKYGSASGRYQELEGPPIARSLLEPFGLPAEFVDRVCFLIGHHHTYSEISGLDYQILVEADFLVNLYEDGCTPEQVRAALERIFRTETGKCYLSELFLSK